MKRKNTWLIGALCASSLGSVFAAEVTWTGAVDNKWDTTTENWRTSEGVACRFSSGDDVVFPNASENYSVSVNGSVSVGTVLVDADVNVRISGTISEMSLLTKRGVGQLEMNGRNSTYEGDINIEEGELYIQGWRSYRQSWGDRSWGCGHLGNGLVERTITIGENASFYTEDPWPWGGPMTDSNVRLVVNGRMSGWYPASGWGNAPIAFGELVLNTSDFELNGSDLTDKSNFVSGSLPSRTWASFAMNGDVYFNMDEPYTFSGTGDMWIGLGATVPTLYVKDITGDDASDVFFNKAIGNSVPMGVVKANNAFSAWENERRPSRFIKDGPGTLEMMCPNSFTGDLVVRGGCIRAKGWSTNVQTVTEKGPLGNPQVERSIVVEENGEIEIAASYGTTSAYANNKMTFAVTNGTIRLMKDQYGRTISLNFGNIDFYDANVVYSAQGNNIAGYFTMGAEARFDGTQPCVFPVVGGNSWVQLGYGSDYEAELVDDSGTGNLAQTHATYRGCTEMTVCDITGKNTSGDCVADVTFNPALRNVPGTSSYSVGTLYDSGKTPMYRTHICGLTKLGSGTLVLAHNDNRYSGPTKVKEGALVVDGKITQSAVTVYEGGFIGGAGTVPSLTMESGAGFVVNGSNPTQQLSVTGEWVAPEVGVLWLTGFEGAVESVKKLATISVAGAVNVSDVHPEEWTVRMDGYTAKETRDLVVELVDDRFVVSYHKKGTTVLLR